MTMMTMMKDQFLNLCKYMHARERGTIIIIIVILLLRDHIMKTYYCQAELSRTFVD